MSYILPIRARQPVTPELLQYLDELSGFEDVSELIVVDRSAPDVYADFEARRGPRVRHVPVDPDLLALANGKVAGVLTGVRHASTDRLVLADEDVRYDELALRALGRELDRADLVRPQNYFAPLPWHACLDTARSLINRVSGGDWPGTFGVRRAAFLRSGGYDGNVLFENLELVRTVRAIGGREHRPLDLFVRRLPPQTSHFWSQRVRQAYDEFARPARMLFWLSVLPSLWVLTARRGRWVVVASMAAAVASAEAGRRIGGGTRVFPLRASIAAPLWVLERGICSWLALLLRVTLGGVPYAGRRVRRAATPFRTLARRFASAARDPRISAPGLDFPGQISAK